MQSPESVFASMHSFSVEMSERLSEAALSVSLKLETECMQNRQHAMCKAMRNTGPPRHRYINRRHAAWSPWKCLGLLKNHLEELLESVLEQ